MSRSARVHPLLVLLLLLFSVFLFYWDSLSLLLSLVAADTSYTQLKQDPDTPKNTRAGKLAVQLRGQHETVATGWACQAATLARPLLCRSALLIVVARTVGPSSWHTAMWKMTTTPTTTSTTTMMMKRERWRIHCQSAPSAHNKIAFLEIYYSPRYQKQHFCVLFSWDLKIIFGSFLSFVDFMFPFFLLWNGFSITVPKFLLAPFWLISLAWFYGISLQQFVLHKEFKWKLIYHVRTLEICIQSGLSARWNL